MEDDPVVYAAKILARMQKEQFDQSIAISRGCIVQESRCPLNQGESATLFLTSDETPVVITLGGLKWVAAKDTGFMIDVWGIISGAKAELILRNENPFRVGGEIEVLQTPYLRHAQAYMTLIAPFVTMYHDWLLPLGPVFAQCKRD